MRIIGDGVPGGAPYIVPKGYEELVRIYLAALERAANGKGQERHANGRPFEDQPMLQIAAGVGVGFPIGQAIKKSYEAAMFINRGEIERGRAELLDAINYLAGGVIDGERLMRLTSGE